MKTIAIIGPGRVGSAVGHCLHVAGYAVRAVCASSLPNARRATEFIGAGQPCATPSEAVRLARIVLLTTPDDRIESVCREIADSGALTDSHTVVHFSGVYSSSILQSAADQGARIASCHPMQSFATAEQAVGLIPGTPFACEGAPDALEVVHAMIDAIGGRLLSIPTDGKIPYHIAAVMACNYLVALLDAAGRLYEGLGIGPEQANEALTPLLRGTLTNVADLGAVEALTGPIARGDAGVVETHLLWLTEHEPGLLEAYVAMGRLAVDLARRKGTLNAEQAARLDQVLNAAGRRPLTSP